LTIKSTAYSNNRDIKIPYGMQFDYDEKNLIIRKSDNPTKGVKIPWGPS
jgi:hypothetical protein